LNLKANFESSWSHFSFKSLVPVGFKVGFLGSTCSALPGGPPARARAPAVAGAALWRRKLKSEQSLTAIHHILVSSAWFQALLAWF
jgi:hypothetical protein